MRKSSSQTGGGKRPGSDSSFSNSGPRKDAKPFKKKNYDGRSGSAGDGPSRPSRPYSGRTTDGEAGKFRSDKPFGKEPRRGASKEFDKPRKPYGDKPFSDRPKRSFDKPAGRDGEPRKPYGDKPFSDRPKRSFDKPGGRDGAPREPRKPYGDKPFSDRPKRSFDKPDGDGARREPRKSYGDKPFSDRPKRSFDKPDREGAPREPGKEFDKPRQPYGDKPFSDKPKKSFDKSSFKKDDGGKRGGKTADSRPFRDRPKAPPVEKFEKIPDVVSFSKDIDDVLPGKYDVVSPEIKYDKPKGGKGRKEEPAEKKPHTPSGKKKRYQHNHDDDDDEDEDDKEINQTNGPRLEMPLNKFIAHSGECSRRDAAELVRQGKVKVNEELVLDPGYRVKHDDKVTLSGKKLTPQKGMVYILLNKPKGFITTNEDPQGRKTVMELVGNSGVDRLFPVGRLDRDTSGLLLITNDGDLTQKLCHPSYNIKKVYQVTLDKPLTTADFEKIIEGVELEDGKAVVDELAWLEKKNELGLEIHSGRNRIVRRIFESLGYVVDKLDRMMYAGLTKKNLPRGKWRYLNEREIVLLKHFKS